MNRRSISKIDTNLKTCSKELLNPSLPTFVDFFAGSGLVTQGAKLACSPVWSNDIYPDPHETRFF